MREMILSMHIQYSNYRVKPDRMPNTEEQICPSTQVPCPEQHHNPSPLSQQHKYARSETTNK